MFMSHLAHNLSLSCPVPFVQHIHIVTQWDRELFRISIFLTLTMCAVCWVFFGAKIWPHDFYNFCTLMAIKAAANG